MDLTEEKGFHKESKVLDIVEEFIASMKEEHGKGGIIIQTDNLLLISNPYFNMDRIIHELREAQKTINEQAKKYDLPQ